MRIDYSEPKKSYKNLQTGYNRPKKQFSGSMLALVLITAIISLAVGFGSGWTLSQRAAKRGFKAAMEQQSLENSPNWNAAQPSPQKPQTTNPNGTVVPQQPQSGGVQTTSAAPETQKTPDSQLSFFKNLPSGQKNNVLGSGINSMDDKPAKQPLQAAIPSNFTPTPQPQNSSEASRQPASTGDNHASRQGAVPFTVQVSSYSLKSEAETLKDKLKSKGYSAYISESNQGSKGIWYRVRVGKGLDQEAARELAGKLGKGSIAIPEKE